MTLSLDVFNLLNRLDTYQSYRVSYPSTGTTANPGVVPATVDAGYVRNLQPQQNWIGSARQIQVGARFAF
jgi:hypothetical protein